MTKMIPERDALEETQEMMSASVSSGVYRTLDSSWRRSPELSLRYPSTPIDFLKRQAD